jgi:hypothetical protein
MEVLIGPGSPSPLPELMVDLLRNFGGWLLDVNDESEDIIPGLFDVR